MSGSKKGSKRRPYRTGRTTPVHVLLRTPEEATSDAWECGQPTTRELLATSIEDLPPIPTPPSYRRYTTHTRTKA